MNLHTVGELAWETVHGNVELQNWPKDLRPAQMCNQGSPRNVVMLLHSLLRSVSLMYVNVLLVFVPLHPDYQASHNTRPTWGFRCSASDRDPCLHSTVIVDLQGLEEWHVAGCSIFSITSSDKVTSAAEHITCNKSAWVFSKFQARKSKWLTLRIQAACSSKYRSNLQLAQGSPCGLWMNQLAL